MSNTELKVTTTDDTLQLYEARDLTSSVVAQISNGVRIQLGAATAFDGREWMEAALSDGRTGYLLAPSVRGHTNLRTERLELTFDQIENWNTPPPAPIPKQRSGCLTVWLVLTVIWSFVSVVVYPFASMLNAELQRRPQNPGFDEAARLLVLLAAFRLAFVIALFRWKKWGFWGLCGVAAAGVAADLGLDLGIAFAVITALASVALLYGALQIGGEDNSWDQLD